MAIEEGEQLTQAEIAQLFPDAFKKYNKWSDEESGFRIDEDGDHDFIEHAEYTDILDSDVKVREDYVRIDGQPVLIEDLEYNARQYDWRDELEGIFGDPELYKSKLLRGQTYYEKYTDKTGNLLGIKRKRYKVKSSSEGKLEQELDKQRKFDQSKGKLHVRGQPDYEDYPFEPRGFFDN